MIERVWWASSPPQLVTVSSKAMSSSVGVMTATPSSLTEGQSAQSCSAVDLFHWACGASSYPLSDLNTLLPFCVCLEQKSYSRWRLLWQMLSLPQPLFRRVICQKHTGQRSLLTLSKVLICSCGQRRLLKLNCQDLCTSETLLLGWKRSSMGVTCSLVHWVELPRDIVTETGIECSRSLKSRCTRSGHSHLCLWTRWWVL